MTESAEVQTQVWATAAPTWAQPQPQSRPQPQAQPKAGAPAIGDVDCSDFGSSAEAQRYLPGDTHGLDKDGDGKVCDRPR
jgi:putative hemolysin